MLEESVAQTETCCCNERHNPMPRLRTCNPYKNDCAGKGIVYKWLIKIRSNRRIGDGQYQENRRRNLRGMPENQTGAGSINGQVDFECDVFGDRVYRESSVP